MGNLRRDRKSAIALAVFLASLCGGIGPVAADANAEVLYNGITLPEP